MAIDPKSVASHHLVLYAYAVPISTGSAFVVQVNDVPILITNYHILSGRHPDTGAPLSDSGVTPDRVLVPYLRMHSSELRWGFGVHPLITETGSPLWIEHPRLGQACDVVALPIRLPQNCMIVPYPIDPGPNVALYPASDVAIVGFPEGMSAAGITAIWKRGSVASEPSLFDPKSPFFWVDANTRKGMSGAPVIARRFGGAMMEDGNYALGAGVTDRLVGVYAGRALNAPDMTLGRVWKWDTVREVVDSALSLVYRGVYEPRLTTLGYIQEENNAMVKLDVKKSVKISVQLPTGAVESKDVSVGGLIREFVLGDDRFGVNLERVKAAAALDSAVASALEGDGQLNLQDADYAVIREVVQNPTKPYNALVARQILPLLEYILDAGQSAA